MADALSRERLSRYLARTGGDTGRALALYVWNAGVGAALTVTLSQVEVGLRNAISRALTDAYQPSPADPPWHRVARFRHAHPAVQAELAKAEDRLGKAAPTLPDVVAACDFNLWRELCKPAYAGAFWGRRVPLAFPHASPLGKGKEREFLAELHRRVDLLLELRNRIAHHEPIVGSSWEPLGARLAVRHAEAVELLGWISPDLAAWVAERDRFAETMAACPEPGGAPRKAGP
ncbi:hypothetical protein NF552_22710 (plasmid) [Roseomonas mucosa]|nr:hypothetical protein NF552_22710 [Roseomonas mucosa]